MPSVATLIVARNAEETVGPAIESALAEPIDELVFVDDASSDETLKVVRSYADSRIRLVELAQHRTLGYARGRGLEAVQSDLCFLLDADDAFLPGRIERLSSALETDGADFVADELELVNGSTGEFIRRLTIPGFLDRPPGLLRLFERNYLPGIGQIGFRTKVMRKLGYDPNIHGGEDADLVFRALASGSTGKLVREIGYQMKHYAGSISRNREQQGDGLALALRKHSVDRVELSMLESGAPNGIAAWAVYSLAVFQKDYRTAKSILKRIAGSSVDLDEVIDPLGPCPLSEGWRLGYAEGTLALLQGEAPEFARDRLAAALLVKEEPELLNNMGVAFARMGEFGDSEQCFLSALALNPAYADARENLSSVSKASWITSHPLRREPSRSEY